jgi:hypothetical protein
MRLGQLARKLELRPAEIVEFLATKNIVIEDDANSKVDENYVGLVIRQFAPDKEVENIPDADIATVSVLEDLQSDEKAPGEVVTPEVTPADEVPPERNEVIKAAKVELSGLKVLGKIDLPDSKKKQPEAAQENSDTEQPRQFNREKKNPNYKKIQRSSKNPIALQREREALEAQKKREEELQFKKEKRTQNYLKKVKAHQPTKAAKLHREEAEEMSAAELAEPPKTLWGKFVRWLTT